jgi:hypothetical protein
MKSSIFWDIKPCCSFKVHRCFGGTCHRHLQGRRISQATYLPHSGFLFSLFFDPLNGGDMFPEMSVDLQRTTWRYIPEGKLLISCVHYNAQPVNAAWKSNYFLFWELYETPKHTVSKMQTFLILEQEIHVGTTMLQRVGMVVHLSRKISGTEYDWSILVGLFAESLRWSNQRAWDQ